MSSQSEKKKQSKRYRLDHTRKDPNIDINCRRNGDSYGTFMGHSGRVRFFCKVCYRVGNAMQVCPTCGADTVRLDPRARVPRKNASKTKWRNFFANFFPDLLDRME